MTELEISAGGLGDASVKLSNAGEMCVNAGIVSTGADFGSGTVADAVANFASAMRLACGATQEMSSSNANWASGTVTHFAALDAKLATAVTT